MRSNLTFAIQKSYQILNKPSNTFWAVTKNQGPKVPQAAPEMWALDLFLARSISYQEKMNSMDINRILHELGWKFTHHPCKVYSDTVWDAVLGQRWDWLRERPELGCSMVSMVPEWYPVVGIAECLFPQSHGNFIGFDSSPGHNIWQIVPSPLAWPMSHTILVSGGFFHLSGLCLLAPRTEEVGEGWFPCLHSPWWYSQTQILHQNPFGCWSILRPRWENGSFLPLPKRNISNPEVLNIS